tara:strand:+ start:8 stop:1000 length:993 start_codon:yes stop_codon:yes gene_type:complete
MTKYTSDHPHYNEIINKLDNFKLDEIHKSHLYFALGKYFEDIRDHKKSFLNYSNGNEIIKRLSKYRIEEEEKEFIKIKNFDYNKLENTYQMSRKLIFIIGMPRSGTSLVEQILSSHKEIFGGGELSFLEKEVKKMFLILQNKNDIENNDVHNLILNFKNEYLKKISNYDSSNKIFTDKAPLNFRFIGFIKYIFPNAKVINCVRDPMDIAWSNFKNYFSNSMPFTNNLEDIGKFYNLYKDLMSFWRKKFPNFIYDIEYLKLVENPKFEIEKLLNFCEIKWDENCLNHHKNDRAIKTASSTQARKPIYKTAIKSSDVYKEYLKDLESIINFN